MDPNALHRGVATLVNLIYVGVKSSLIVLIGGGVALVSQGSTCPTPNMIRVKLLLVKPVKFTRQPLSCTERPKSLAQFHMKMDKAS